MEALAGDGSGVLPQYDAAILSAATGMFPRLPTQLQVHSATDTAINVASCIDPSVHDQARAGLEVKGLIRFEACVQVVEKGCGGDLRGRRVARACSSSVGRGRIDRHAGVVDEAHGGFAVGSKPRERVEGCGFLARMQQLAALEDRLGGVATVEGG